MSARTTVGVVSIVLAALGLTPLLHCANTSPPADSELAPDPPDAAADVLPEANPFNGDTPLPQKVECAETTKQIYVLATDLFLYRFYPDKLSFVSVGQVACPTSAGTFSMAIDRYGIAWVEYTDGRVFAVDTTNATCRPTPFKPGRPGFETFGMGFAKDDTGGGSETLYVAGVGLASLDTKTFDLKFLGSLNYGRTELTGRGAELFAFSVESGVIAGLNKSNGATQVTYRTTAVNERAAFAFAQWGGDFWVFTGDDHSIVTQYSPTENKSTVVVQNTGMLIVGAGSSTCAPTTKGPR
jgi:hypothetical protein